MRTPHNRKRLTVERLEDRVVPAAHPVAVAGAAAYRYGDEIVTLDSRADELVIGLPGGAAALAALAADHGPLAGLAADRWLTSELVVLSAPIGRLADAAAAPGVTFAAPVYQNPATGGWLVATNEVIVALAPGADTSALADPRISGWVPLSGTPDQFVVKAAAGYGAAAFDLAESLHGDPRFAWAAPNFYQDVRRHFTPNDTLYTSQWHLNNTVQQPGQTAGADVDAPLAWDVTQGSQNIIVSVVDDGMEIIHPDLAPNIAINQGEIPAAIRAALTDMDGDTIISFLDLNNAVNIGPGKAVDVNANGRIDPDDILAAAASGGWVNSLDGDSNGYVDDLCGWDFTTNGAVGDNNPGADGVNDAHATSVAGVAVGVGNNNLGTTGIAFRSRILPVRIFGTTGAYAGDANTASAVYYAAGRTQNGLGTFRAGDVMNNSWGGGSPSAAITAAFTWASTNGRAGKGTPSFISSGNDYDDAVSYPSVLAGTIPGVISVGASTDVETRSSYSNYGPELDFVTPSSGPGFGGVYGIVTTDRTAANGYNTAAGLAGNYTNTFLSGFGGTSSASPLAAGIGALVLAADPTLTALQVRTLMRASTELIGLNYNAAGFAVGYGYGKANANAAVRGVGVAEVQVLDDRANVADGTGSVSFGSVGVGGVGATRTFRVRNQGTQTLTLGAVGVSGPFELVSGLSSSSLTTNQYATFSVRFLPTATGAGSGTVTFTNNDLNEGTFDFTVTGTGVAPSLAGRPYEDWAGNGAADANDPSLAGRQVFLDLNGNGSHDAALTPVAFNSGTISVAVPDGTGGIATHSQTVANTSGLISKVTVRASITHTYVSDITVELVGPSGLAVMLFSGRGGSGDNLTNTVFDDAAATWIGNGSAPFTGTFRPEEALAAFIGGGANGAWTLRVRDFYTGDVGTITSWTLNLTLAEPTQTTTAAGTYAFAGLPAATYAVRTVVPAGWTSTGPAGGSYSQVLSAGGSVTGLDFGSVRQNAVYGQMVNDLNGNGVRDGGEPVMAGWRVFDDRNGNGSLDGGEVNALTDASGNYILPGLAAGATMFRVERQAGYRTTLGVAGLSLTVVTNGTYHNRDFGAIVDTTAPTADVTDVTPDPRTTAVSSVTIVFGEAVTGFDLSDLSLTRDGGGSLLTGSQTLTTSDNITWTLGNLSGLTGAVGTYVLTVIAAGSNVQDAAQNTLAVNASDTWTVVSPGSLSVSDVTVGEGGGSAVFTVSLPGASPDTITVNYATANGTATVLDGDYTATSGSLTFAPGETTKTVSVPVLNDPRDEDDETFVLNLSAPTNATIADGQGVALITDDDPLPALSIDSVTVTEGNSGNVPLAFTVTLSAVSGRTVTVNYATANGTAIVLDGDYTATSGSLTFLPGETSKTVTVQAAGDVRDEINETFAVNLTGAVNATISAATGTGTITDDDPTPTLAIGGATLAEGTGGTTPFVFTVTLSAVSGQTVTVNYGTADGTATVLDGDFTAASGALTFAPGETTKTVTVQVAADTRDEPDETFAVTLSGAANATITTATGTGTITDDDPTPTLSVNSLSLAEGGGSFAFTVTLSAASGRTVTVNYGTADGSATVADGDYTAASGTLTFLPGETTKTVTVPVANDARDEDDETLTVTLGAPSNATITTGTGTGTITDDDPLPALSIDSVTATEGNSGNVPLAFTVTLSAVSGRTVAVNFGTANGTATVLDGDYTATSGTLTFLPGQTSKTVTVQAAGDLRDEPDETFTVTLTGAVNATISAATGTGTITDDDPTPTLSVNSVSLAEGTGGTTPFAFTVTLSAASGRTVTVNYGTASGSATVADGDFTATSGTLTFLPGETTKTVAVPVTADARDEDDEAFTVTLSGAANATITTGTGTGTITDDDAPPALSINSVSLAEGGGAFGFTVTLSAVSGKTVAVNFGTADGSATVADGDYTAASGTLTFLPGETTKTVTVPVTNDVRDEDDETLTVTLSAPSNATIAAGTGTGTITDDDAPPALSIDSVTLPEGNGGSTPFVFAVTLSAVSGRTVTVNFGTANGNATVLDGDFAATSGTLTFLPGQTSKTVTVQAAGDLRDEPDETFTVTLTGETNATVSSGTGTGTITDDDPTPTLSVNSVSLAEGTGGTTPFAFAVTLSAVSGRTVTVNYGTASGSATVTDGDFTAASGTLTFLPGETTKTVTVPVAADTRDEDDEAFTVTLSAPTNATITTGTGTGTIADDDAPPALSIGPVTRAEGAGPFVFTVTLSAVSGKTVTVSYGTADGTATVLDGDYTAASGTLTFAPGETTKTISVPVTGDARNEDDETFTVTLSGATNATVGAGTATGTITDDDPLPGLAVDSLTLTEGNGGSTPFAFTVTLSAVSGRTVTVNFATANGTATVLDGDYAATSGTLTFLPGETSKTIIVQAAGDARDEINETFAVNLSGETNATITTGTGTGTITDDDPTPTLAINSVTRLEGNSGSTPFAFTVTLSAVSGRTVTVNYATANGTATVGDGDYTAASGTLTFLPGEVTKTITVQAAGETRNETDETFAVNLSGAGNATIATGTGTGTITNDDPLPTLSVASVTRAEGTGGSTAFTFTVSLSAASGRTVTVNYGTADGTATVGDGDYTAASGTLTFAPGVTTRTFTVAVAGDARNEDAETFGVSLSLPGNATLGAAAATGTITDDDPLPTLSVNSVSLPEGTGGPTPVAFTVSLSAVSGRTVTVNYGTADGTATAADGDYTAAAGSVTFAPGETTKTVVVQAGGDARNEDDETFALVLGTATNATVAAGTGTATLVNDDPVPTLAVDSVSLAEGDGGTTIFTFTVTLSAVSGKTVTVGFGTADGSATVADGDYAAASGTLTFAPGVTTRTFTVAVTGELRNEIDETFTATLSGAANATIAAGTGTGTLVNDDPEPTLAVNSVSAVEGSALAFTVSLSAVSGRTVSVNYATANGTATTANGDYTAASGTLTFAPGETTKSVSVATAGDNTFELNETFTLNLGTAANAGVAAGTGTGTVTNDDAVPTATLSGGGTVGESSGSATVTVTLSNPSYLPVTVTLAAGGTTSAGDADTPPVSVTIPAGLLSSAFGLAAIDDGDDEPDETLVLSAAGVANGTAAGGPVTITITDDDLPVAAAAGFDLTEDTPFATPTSLLAAANAQPGSVAELVGAAPAGGTLTLNPDGTFTFAPAADVHGTVGFQYRVRNPAGEVSAPAAVELRVAAVNDAPTFTAGPDQTDPRRGGAQVVPGWATAISAGPADEAGQRLTFEVTTDNPTLFAVQPAIDPATGTLTYTPGAGFGRAVVTVRLRDSGGGTDASAARAFGVEVLKYRDDNLPTNQDEVGLIGVGSGDAGSVAAFRGDGAAAGTSTPFTGASARVVTADVTGDGVADTIAATGPGVRSRVVVIDGATGAVARTILPFEDTFVGGLFVAAADVDGDGKAEIAVSPDTGGGGRVTVFGGSGAVADFFGIDDKAFRGGARVTFGDVNGDGTPDLVVVAGFGGGPRTAIYDGTTLSAGPTRLVNDFFAFPGSDAVNLRNGVFVSAGDVDGDGFADLAFGGGPGGAPRVFVLSGALVSAGRVEAAQAAPVGNFFVAGNASDRGGVRVAVKDLDGDARLDVVAGSGEGSAARVRVYAGAGFGGGGEPGDFFDLEPFGGAVLSGGVYVG